jgi:hypothetical protein
MQARAVALTAAAALVALGGVYLLVQVRASGAAAPSEQALAEARARHARTAPPSMSATRPQRDGIVPSIPKPDRPAPRPDEEPPARPTSKFDGPNLAAMPGMSLERAEATAGVDPELDSAMLETNKLYDRHQFDEARTQALKLLERAPGSVRMMRVVVSSSCILGDGDTAQKYWTELPEFDRGQMTSRCERFGITFK